jgi:NAD(P)-dependent dehydrogenase (short-subunit alcohol dehydrogenase family)
MACPTAAKCVILQGNSRENEMVKVMHGKICLITGANNGIGFETCKELSRLGATVVMVCRNQQRGEAARDRITSETGQTPDLLWADLRLQEEVKRVAGEFRSRYDRLDVLVNNAGAVFFKREETPEGFESTFALNYLAYFTLTMELMESLLAADGARIINVSSRAHTWNPMDFDNLQGEREFPMGKFGMPAMYGWTNLYRIMFTYELAERLQNKGIVANAINPGFVPVKRSTASAFSNLLMSLFSRMPGTISPNEAAQTIINLATSPDAASQSGKYYSEGELAQSSDETYSQALRVRLWKKTLSLAGYENDPLLDTLTDSEN